MLKTLWNWASRNIQTIYCIDMNIKYCGPALDYSGYGEANRHDIAALASADIGVQVELTKHCLEISEFGSLGQMVRDLATHKLDYSIKILHTTPNIYNQFIEPGKYHIGRVFWETDKLPPDFVAGIQLVDEIWTGSKANADAIRNSGIDKPIYIIPEAVDINIGDVQPYKIPMMTGEQYRFYSVFEWTERKNPLALLEAYWREFEHTDGVALVIKTYVDNFMKDKRRVIDEQIAQLKRRVKLEKYAPMYLFRNLIGRNQIYSFHKTFDCFVSTHRGEGWGIPQMEAMLTGNPIISTGWGGIHEYVTDQESAYLLPYEMVKLESNSRNQQWYRDDQNWCDVKVDDIRKVMRHVFDHRGEAKKVGFAGQTVVTGEFAVPIVGQLMKERINAIKVTT